MKRTPEYYNQRASNPKYNHTDIIDNLTINKGDLIVDFGSGGGFYSYKFSELAGESGKVFALDVEDDYLKYIQNQAKLKNFNNIQTINSEKRGLDIKDNSINLIFIRNVLHHLEDRIDLFNEFNRILADGGKLVIIDYTKKGTENGYGKIGHYLEPEIIFEECSKANLKRKENLTILPGQSFQIFGL